jgi:hypothetical protein
VKPRGRVVSVSCVSCGWMAQACSTVARVWRSAVRIGARLWGIKIRRSRFAAGHPWIETPRGAREAMRGPTTTHAGARRLAARDVACARRASGCVRRGVGRPIHPKLSEPRKDFNVIKTDAGAERMTTEVDRTEALLIGLACASEQGLSRPLTVRECEEVLALIASQEAECVTLRAQLAAHEFSASRYADATRAVEQAEAARNFLQVRVTEVETLLRDQHTINAAWQKRAYEAEAEVVTLRAERDALQHQDGLLNKTGREQFDRAEKAEAERGALQENEQHALQRLSRALTGGNAGTWDEIFDAADKAEADLNALQERDVAREGAQFYRQAAADAKVLRDTAEAERDTWMETCVTLRAERDTLHQQRDEARKDRDGARAALEQLQQAVAQLRASEQDRLTAAYKLPINGSAVRVSNAYLNALADVEASLSRLRGVTRITKDENA